MKNGSYAARASLALVSVAAMLVSSVAANAATTINGYYIDQHSGAVVCGGSTAYCKLSFSTVPAGKTLLISQIGYHFKRTGSSSPALPDDYYLMALQNVTFHLPLPQQAPGTNLQAFVASVYIPVKGGQYPSVNVRFGANNNNDVHLNMDCEIVGFLITS